MRRRIVGATGVPCRRPVRPWRRHAVAIVVGASATLLVATGSAAPAPAAAGCLTGLFTGRTTPIEGTGVCDYTIRAKMTFRYESAEENQTATFLAVGTRRMRLFVRSYASSSGRPGGHVEVSGTPVAARVTASVRITNTLAPCDVTKRYAAAAKVTVFGSAYETKELGFPPPPHFGGLHISVEPRSELRPPDGVQCVGIPQDLDISIRNGVERRIGSEAPLALEALFSFRKSQRPGRLGFPFDRIASGESFVVSRSWSATKPGYRTSTTVSIEFTRGR
jgi:hypothetical protein